jgi:hypothetical protein
MEFDKRMDMKPKRKDYWRSNKKPDGNLWSREIVSVTGTIL